MVKVRAPISQPVAVKTAALAPLTRLRTKKLRRLTAISSTPTP
jgi:hypothetical protein